MQPPSVWWGPAPHHPPALEPHQPHSREQDEGWDTCPQCAEHPAPTSNLGMASPKIMVLCPEERRQFPMPWNDVVLLFPC